MKKLNLCMVAVIAVLLISGCKKSNDNTKTTTITATYYFKGTLNGQAVVWQAAIDGSPGYYVGASAALSRDQGVTTGALTGLLSAAGGFVPQLGVEFRTFQVNYNQDIPTYFNGFVSTGAWALATNSDYTAGKKAVAIYYTDKNNKQYNSIGAQTGNTATVLAVTQVPARIGSNESLKIKLTFSCTLYPADGTGANLSLTGAEATVLVEDQLY